MIQFGDYYADGEYYAVKLSDGTFYKGGGFVFDTERTTTDISKADLFMFDWQIPKDLYLSQFLNANRDISIDKYVKVRLKTNIEIITEVVEEEPNASNI